MSFRPGWLVPWCWCDTISMFALWETQQTQSSRQRKSCKAICKLSSALTRTRGVGCAIVFYAEMPLINMMTHSCMTLPTKSSLTAYKEKHFFLNFFLLLELVGKQSDTSSEGLHLLGHRTNIRIYNNQVTVRHIKDCCNQLIVYTCVADIDYQSHVLFKHCIPYGMMHHKYKKLQIWINLNDPYLYHPLLSELYSEIEGLTHTHTLSTDKFIRSVLPRMNAQNVITITTIKLAWPWCLSQFSSISGQTF